jgi:hypothetical protein
LSVVVVVVVVVLVLLLLFWSEFEVLRLLLSVVVVVLVLLSLLSVERVVVCVTVLPPFAVTPSWAWALSEKASEIAVTSKVLFIRVPLWV